MTALKRIFLFYFIGTAITIVLILLLEGDLGRALTYHPFWWIPLPFALAGWLIGAGVYELMLKPKHKKNQVFLISHIIVIAGFAAISLWARLEARKILAIDNARRNRVTMWYSVDDNEKYILTGFERLESEFGNPNDLTLDAFSVRKRDTVIGNTRDTLYTVYYAYYLRGKKGLHFSKLAMWQNKPELLIFNQPTKSNEEYKVIQAGKDTNEQEAVKLTKEAFEMIDSINKKKNSQQ